MKYILVFLLTLSYFNCAIKCNQQTDSKCEKCTFLSAFKSLETIQKIAAVCLVLLSNLLLSGCLALAIKYFPFRLLLRKQEAKQESTNMFSLFSIFNKNKSTSTEDTERPIPTIHIKTQENIQGEEVKQQQQQHHSEQNDLEFIQVVKENN